MVTMLRILNMLGAPVDFDGSMPRQIRCLVHGVDFNPSARYYPGDEGSVYCWTCHKSWTPVALYAEVNGMSISAAERDLAKMFGLKVVSTARNKYVKLDDLLVAAINAGCNVDDILTRSARGSAAASLIPELQKLLMNV